MVTSWASKKSLAAARRAGDPRIVAIPQGLGCLAQVKELDRVPPFSLDAGVSGMMRHHLATGDDASIMLVRLPVGPFFFGAH